MLCNLELLNFFSNWQKKSYKLIWQTNKCSFLHDGCYAASVSDYYFKGNAPSVPAAHQHHGNMCVVMMAPAGFSGFSRPIMHTPFCARADLVNKRADRWRRWLEVSGQIISWLDTVESSLWRKSLILFSLLLLPHVHALFPLSLHSVHAHLRLLIKFFMNDAKLWKAYLFFEQKNK